MEAINKLGRGLITALMEVEDIDHLQGIYCSNSIADTAPAVQKVLHDLFQAERKRRSLGDVDSFGLPVLSSWHPVNLLQAGAFLIPACEAGAMAEDPAIQNFGFRLLQYYFGELAKAHLEFYPCEPA